MMQAVQDKRKQTKHVSPNLGNVYPKLFQNNTFRIHSQANWQAWLFRSTFFLKKRNNNISKCAQFVGSMCVLFCFLSLSLMLFCFIQIVRVPSHSTTTPPKHKTTNRFSQLKSTIDLKQKTKNEGFCLFKDFFFYFE